MACTACPHVPPTCIARTACSNVLYGFAPVMLGGALMCWGWAWWVLKRPLPKFIDNLCPPPGALMLAGFYAKVFCNGLGGSSSSQVRL